MRRVAAAGTGETGSRCRWAWLADRGAETNSGELLRITETQGGNK